MSIKINNTGPKIFLSRLKETNIDLEDNIIFNPDKYSVKKAKKSKSIIIGRLDGTSYYNFTKKNFNNFLKLRKKKKLYNLVKFMPHFFFNKKLSKFLNMYIDRKSLWLLNNADGLIFQSQLSLNMHKTFLNYEPLHKPYKIIYNGIDTNIFYPSKLNQDLKKNVNVITSASTYRLHKRLLETIKLINYVSLVIPNVTLHILGDLDQLTQSSIASIDKSRCKFYGKVNHVDLPRFYQIADLQIHLSIFDPCPNVVVEGLACGLPVITPIESGAFELIGKENEKWACKENLKIEYKQLHLEKEIPKIDLSQYSKIFFSILNNLSSNRHNAYVRAKEKLDIRIIANQYIDFIKYIKKISQNS